jgi:hypothetical protein
MTTITLLRQTYLNKYLSRSDSDTVPWASTDLDQLLGDAIRSLWPVHGVMAVGDVATSSTTQEYTVPASIQRVSRIEMLDTDGYYVGAVTNWRPTTSGKVVIKPRLADGYTLRVTGWKPFADTGSDLPANLEDVVAKLGASLAYGALAAYLTNSQKQQNLDTGRIVDHQQAISLSAYWSQQAESRLFRDPSRVAYAPRRAQRG